MSWGRVASSTSLYQTMLPPVRVARNLVLLRATWSLLTRYMSMHMPPSSALSAYYKLVSYLSYLLPVSLSHRLSLPLSLLAPPCPSLRLFASLLIPGLGKKQFWEIDSQLSARLRKGEEVGESPHHTLVRQQETVQSSLQKY